MKRPRTFDDIIGHDWHVQYFKDHITRGTLKHFLIIEGQEGLGKTSFADLIALNLVYGMLDSPEKDKAYNTVVSKKVSNDYIKKFEMSVEGGKEVAKEVRAEMQATFTLNRPKVIICDECHNLSEAAQDVFLSETEYISDKVYIIMLTTELEKLKASLRSRAVPIHLSPLKMTDMLRVLQNEVRERRLNIQNEAATLSMIAEWAECKPRTGLNILNAFANDSAVSSNMIRELIGYMDTTDIVPLIESLSGSMTFGLSYISEMKVDNSLVSVVVEIVRILTGGNSYKLKMTDVAEIRQQLVNVTPEQVITFLYGITRHQKLQRVDIINAYISAHSSRKQIVESNPEEMLAVEKTQKADFQMKEDVTTVAHAPSIEDLLRDSDIIMEGN